MVSSEMQAWQQAGILNSIYTGKSSTHKATQLKRDWNSIHAQTLDAPKGCHFQMMSWYHLCTTVFAISFNDALKSWAHKYHILFAKLWRGSH